MPIIFDGPPYQSQRGNIKEAMPELPGATQSNEPTPELAQPTVPPPTELDRMLQLWEEMRIQRRNILLFMRRPENEHEVSAAIQRLANLNAVVRLALLEMRS